MTAYSTELTSITLIYLLNDLVYCLVYVRDEFMELLLAFAIEASESKHEEVRIHKENKWTKDEVATICLEGWFNLILLKSDSARLNEKKVGLRRNWTRHRSISLSREKRLIQTTNNRKLNNKYWNYSELIPKN